MHTLSTAVHNPATAGTIHVKIRHNDSVARCDRGTVVWAATDDPIVDMHDAYTPTLRPRRCHCCGQFVTPDAEIIDGQ